MTRVNIGLMMVFFLLAITPVFGQTYLINEDFEGATFPPTGWQNDGAVWSTTTSYSPTHSVKLDGADISISTPILTDPRKLDFRAWYNVVGAMVRVNYSTDGTDWTFCRKFTSSPGWWGQQVSTGLTTLPSPCYLQFIWDEYNDPGAVIYIDNVQVSETTRANPSSNLVLQSGDYNGDGKTDIAVFRPSSGLWAVQGLGRTYFGCDGDRPASGDYNGDGITDVAIYRPSTGLWAVKGLTRTYYGSDNDISVPADYNGDGICDMAVFDIDTGQWKIRGITTIYYGDIDDIPVPGDYNGDRVDEIGIFRPNRGLWAIRGLTRSYFGTTGDIPIPGNYQWYGPIKETSPYRNQIAIYRPESGLWAIQGLTRFYFGNPMIRAAFFAQTRLSSSDVPFRGDFDGNELDDTGIFRPWLGLWAIRGITRSYYGTLGDIPLAK